MEPKLPGWTVVRGTVSFEDALAEWKRLEALRPKIDESYRKARDEIDAGQTIAVIHRPDQDESPPGEPAPPSARPRGRRWTNDLFAARWAAACERSGPPYNYVHIAPEFEFLDGTQRLEGADPGYLGRLWREFGRPPTP